MSYRTFRNFITLRSFRKELRRVLYQHKNATIASKIEKLYKDNAVLIIQKQFFDKNGEACFNGGAERYVKDLAEILFKHGYHPVLIQMGSNKFWTRQIDNLLVIGCPAKITDDYLQVVSNITKYKFVIYSGVYFWGKSIKHPNILISHGITWDTPNQDVQASEIKKILSNVDHLVSVDTTTLSWIRSTFSKSLKNLLMTYIPNYVDTEQFHIKTDKKDQKFCRILFPRRANHERGYWLLSAVIPKILKKYKSVVFDLVGFPHGDQIKQDIQRLKRTYPNRVFHHVVDPSRMPDFYLRSNITLIPTIHSEGTSLSCLEALACGNVVVATNVGGIPNLIINGFNGLLINPSEQDLLKSIETVLSNEELALTLSKNATITAKAFNKAIWEQEWSRIIQTYGPPKSHTLGQ